MLGRNASAKNKHDIYRMFFRRTNFTKALVISGIDKCVQFLYLIGDRIEIKINNQINCVNNRNISQSYRFTGKNRVMLLYAFTLKIFLFIKTNIMFICVFYSLKNYYNTTVFK